MAYTFLRWLRTGLAASLEGAPAAGAIRSALDVGVHLSGQVVAGPLPVRVASAALDVLGPADVIGVDRRQVIRTFPVNGTLDAEPAYLAHIELDRPDLPWLFSPVGPSADAAATVRPWLCLVVVEQGPNAQLTAGLPLPRLTVLGPEVAQLPLLSETHAWVHVQGTGDLGGDVGSVVATAPERILSRLICPRPLTAGTAYLACLVPTYAAGAAAGLGRPLPAAGLADAWSLTDAQAALPVYFHWEFTAGSAGDFTSLVSRLEGRDHLDGVGTRDLDISAPGFGLPDRSGPVMIPLGGALRTTIAAAAPIDPTLALALVPLVASPNVAPPIYGAWHAARHAVALPGAGAQGWLDTLNLDPRYRVAAGLGTAVVQERQEDLMAAIWEQLGAVLRANQQLRNAQFAVATSERIVARHLSALPALLLLSFAGPAKERVRVAPGVTLRGAVGPSCLPLAALSAGFRRTVRGRGPIQRRFARGTQNADQVTLPAPSIGQEALLEALAVGSLNPAPVTLPHGAILVPRPRLVRPPIEHPPVRPIERPVLQPVVRPDVRPVPLPTPVVIGPLADLAMTFARLSARAATKACQPLAFDAIATSVRTALIPAQAIGDRVRARIELPGNARVRLSARLDPILAAPKIDTPLIDPLEEMGLDWLLPGLADVPPNTVSLVEPDPEFVEAYLVGANHEIGREMLWRGFPTDQRGTVFARFWDRRGAVASADALVPDHDIDAIAGWDPASALGDHLGVGTPALVVLLLRADLLLRYPRATIYLHRARWVRDGNGDIVETDGLSQREPVPLPDDAAWAQYVRFPAFVHRAGSDLAFLGYPADRQDVHGLDRTEVPPRSRDDQAGWYAVFQEQPTEPRFGLVPGLPASADRRSDVLAAALLRPSFRLYVHASDLVAR